MSVVSKIIYKLIQENARLKAENEQLKNHNIRWENYGKSLGSELEKATIELAQLKTERQALKQKLDLIKE